MKSCPFVSSETGEQCQEQVQDWQQFCARHWIMVERQQAIEKMKQQAQQQQPSPSPIQPQAQVQTPRPVQEPRPIQARPFPEGVPLPPMRNVEMKESYDEPQPEPQRERPMPQRPIRRQQQPQPQINPVRFEMIPLPDDMRLDIKKICMQSAVSIINNTEYDQKTYVQLLEEIRTLTSSLYRIVVERNEE